MSARSGGPQVVFRCDASTQIGGGHAMRCLTLANALSECGASATFVAASMPDAIATRILDAGHTLRSIAASTEMQRGDAGWEEPPLSVDAQLSDAAATKDAAGTADWMVVDHYLLDCKWHSAARRFASRILVIDDLANRPCDCDILLDQSFGRSADDYRALVPDGTRVLAGGAFALLRPEFADERPAALERRETSGQIRRVLVSMGTGDPGGVTAQVVARLIAANQNWTIDVVLGAQAASLDQVQGFAARDPRVAVHIDTDRMAELMRDADVAVGAAGTTSWERCCLGLPSIALVLAENQRLPALNLERAGAAIAADSPQAIPALLGRLMGDDRMRLSVVAAAAAVTDGRGADRLVEALIGPSSGLAAELSLRPARSDDCRNVWLWRNDPMTRCFSQTTGTIAWPDHHAWWEKTLRSVDRNLVIAELGGKPIAALRFDQLRDDEFEVSINLAPSARGAGLGRRVLTEACRRFRKDKPSAVLTATIHDANPASLRIFESVGFVRADTLSKSPFERYVLREGTPH